MKNKKTDRLKLTLENLFNPINNKDYGLYWYVSNNKKEPLANATELLQYVRKSSTNGKFINRYANLESDLILENNIYLDFDLTNNSYLKAEKGNTEKVLENLGSIIEDISEEKVTDKTKKDFLIKVKKKYEKAYTVENGFIKGFNSFIDSLTNEETGFLVRYVKAVEKEEVKGLSEKEVQKYYLNKFERDYLKEPFKEATTVAKYFESIGVKTVLNWSGSKGLHLRIPINNIDFNNVPELAENPDNVKVFLVALAELIETKILKKPIGTSSLDYHVFNKGMQRIPTSQHNKTLLYANFIEPSVKYLEAIDSLEENVPSYIPSLIDTEKNTEVLIESDIFKATIKKAIDNVTIKTFKSEEGNPNYKFNSNNKELKEMIAKIYLPSLRNILGFQIVHILKRSGFNKAEIEDIFKDLHEDYNDYRATIQGSINYAFKPNAKLIGLKTLIKSIKTNVSPEGAKEVIKYFTKEFKFYVKPEETVLEDLLKIGSSEYEVIFHKVKNTEKYIVPNFTIEGLNLEVELRNYIYFKQGNKTIAKLELNKPKEVADTTIKAKSEAKLKEFIKTILNKNIVPTDKEEPIKKMKEVITELDNIIGYFNIIREQEEELKLQEEEITEELETEGFIQFYFYGLNEIFLQTKTGIYKEVTDSKGIVKLKPVANVVIKDVTIILDSLGILEPVYNVTYYNRTFKKEVTVEYLTEKQLTEEFIKAKVFHNATKDSVNYIINSFIIEGSKVGLIETKTEAYLEGFFMVKNKVVANTKLNNIRRPTPKELAEAIKLLNKIMENRTAEGKANDSAVYRFMLWNPFSYCLKQIGYSKANYSLILIGKSQTNKTGATNIGRLFYNHTEEETTGSTVSVLGSKLEENTFLSVFDECSHLFNITEALNVMKRLVYEKTARATKDRNDNKKIDEFQALALAMFILNERIDLKDFITNRYKVIDYTSKSFITDKTIAEFNEKYVPEAEDTILKKLALIGKVFSEKLIAIIEDPTKRKKLFNIEETTIEILKEISSEAEVDFLPEMYTITEASIKYNYDVANEIRTLLNTEFKKKNKLTANNSYSGFSFTNSIINNDFDFIYYNKGRTTNTAEREFIVNSSGLVKYVNNHVEETVELEFILDVLGLTEILTKKAEANNTDYNSFINKQYKIKVEGTDKKKNITGFYLNVEELANNLFSFNIDFSEKVILNTS